MAAERIRIVADSSADTLWLKDADYASVPLKIVTAEKEYVDDAALDVSRMVEELAAYGGRSSTACPSPGDWMEAFADAERVICVTITSGLSGSCNAACIAKQDYEAKYPERKVCVIDSLSAGPELRLLLEKLTELIASGLEYETVCAEAERYLQKTGLIFMLESMKNLARNGRVSPFAAKAAGLLGIRVVGKASEQGTLELLEKCRGEKSAEKGILNAMLRQGCCGGRVRISYCGKAEKAKAMADLIEATFGAEVEYYPSRGLCSFYAEQGGLLIGFEKA